MRIAVIDSDPARTERGKGSRRKNFQDRRGEDGPRSNGSHHVMSFAQVPDLTALSELVLARIQNVDGVETTQTRVLVSADKFGCEASKSVTVKRTGFSKRREKKM